LINNNFVMFILHDKIPHKIVRFFKFYFNNTKHTHSNDNLQRHTNIHNIAPAQTHLLTPSAHITFDVSLYHAQTFNI
jgi:hypothetical protein